MSYILSTTAFIISASLILVLGLSLLGGLYYIVNIQSNSSPVISYQMPVTDQPTALGLDVTSPDNNTVVFERSILVSGKTAPKSHVLISSPDSDSVVVAKPDGTFSYLFSLEQGNNPISITAFNASGDEKQVSKTVYYSKEKL